VRTRLLLLASLSPWWTAPSARGASGTGRRSGGQLGRPRPAPLKEEPVGGAQEPVPAAHALGTGATAASSGGNKRASAKGVDGPSAIRCGNREGYYGRPSAAPRRERDGPARRQPARLVVGPVSTPHPDILAGSRSRIRCSTPEQLPKYSMSKCKVFLNFNCQQHPMRRDSSACEFESSEDIESLEEKETALLQAGPGGQRRAQGLRARSRVLG